MKAGTQRTIKTLLFAGLLGGGALLFARDVWPSLAARLGGSGGSTVPNSTPAGGTALDPDSANVLSQSLAALQSGFGEMTVAFKTMLAGEPDPGRTIKTSRTLYIPQPGYSYSGRTSAGRGSLLTP